jgi:hypothetical protein
MQVVRRPTQSLEGDAQLEADLRHIVSDIYEDPTALLDRELHHCDTIYTTTDEDGRLAAFFMVAHERLDLVDNGSVDSQYVGLWATRTNLRNTVFGAAVARSWLRDLVAWQKQTLRPLVVWGTTATPLVYEFATRMQRHGQPRQDGTYEPRLNSVALAVRSALNAQGLEADEHPYVLKGVAHGTRYSRSERDRVQQFVRSTGFSLFDRLNIEESTGDRLLFVLNFHVDLLRTNAEARHKSACG